MAAQIIKYLLPCVSPRSRNRKYFIAPGCTNDSANVDEKYTDIPTGLVPDTDLDGDNNDIKVTRAADTFLETLFSASTNPQTSPLIRADLEEHVSTCGGWSEGLAKAILSGLEAALKNGVVVGKAMQDALVKATEAAIGFAKEHPVYTTLLAIGMLCVLAPWVLNWLGFGEPGIVGRSWAALWQSRYAGYVPKGSLFSFLQRMGMTWKWKI